MLGRDFKWLYAAFAASTVGTWVAFDAFPLIAILVLDAGPAEVSLLAACGLAVGALVAVPLGPWVEFRMKRPVMIGTDLVRCAALLSVPVAFWLDGLTLAQLFVVAVIVSAADIAFRSASGACVKALVPPEALLEANGRFEATTWTATAIGPPLGGALIGVVGSMATVVVNAVSFLLSAAGIRQIRAPEPAPAAAEPPDVRAGWRSILAHPQLRPLFFNTVLVNALILATAPLLAVLMLGDLGFEPWEYGLAFGLPCLGGLLGARLARRVADRERVMRASGVLRACWSVGLAFVVSGMGGLVLVMAIQFGLVTCMGVFNPLFATYRLEQTAPDRVARTLAAWNVTSKLTVAATTALWGGLAALTTPRIAIAAAGGLLLLTPALLFSSTADNLSAVRLAEE